MQKMVPIFKGFVLLVESLPSDSSLEKGQQVSPLKPSAMGMRSRCSLSFHREKEEGRLHHKTHMGTTCYELRISSSLGKILMYKENLQWKWTAAHQLTTMTENFRTVELVCQYSIYFTPLCPLFCSFALS